MFCKKLVGKAFDFKLIDIRKKALWQFSGAIRSFVMGRRERIHSFGGICVKLKHLDLISAERLRVLLPTHMFHLQTVC